MSTNDATFQLDFRGQRYQAAEQGLLALARNMDLAPRTAARALRDELLDFLKDVAEKTSNRMSTPYPGGTTSVSLSRRSGRAVRSVQRSPKVRGDRLENVEGSVGGVFYLRTHEFGAVIRPRKAKYLTVPLPAALNANGTPKKRSARQWARTFVFMSKKGNLLIAQRNGSKIVPLYVLKKSVKIPARLHMRDTLRQGVRAFSDYAPAAMLERMVREHFA